MLSLSVPWLLLFFLFVIAILVIKKKWKGGIVLTIIVLTINWWCECVPYRLWNRQSEKDGNTIKVLCFNINGADSGDKGKATRIRGIIRRYKPDVVFISEFADFKPKELDSLLRIDYPFNTFPSSLCNHYFYSKYPLIDYKRPAEMDGQNYEPGLYACHINKGSNTISLLGCHFASNNYTKDRRYLTPNDVESVMDVFQYFKNINNAVSLRNQEARVLIGEVRNSRYPIIAMGDFNDVGGSSVIKIIESSGLKDAWWCGGINYGATIHSPLPYRIDHIFFSSGLILNEIKIIPSEGLSDHDALYAEFEIKYRI